MKMHKIIVGEDEWSPIMTTFKYTKEFYPVCMEIELTDVEFKQLHESLDAFYISQSILQKKFHEAKKNFHEK